MSYKAVIFDMGGVITNYTKMPYIKKFFELAKQDPSVERAWHDLETGKLTMTDGNQIFKNVLDSDPDLRKVMMEASKDGILLTVFDNMSEDEHFAKVLPNLKKAGYLTGLLTNNVFRTNDKKRSVLIEKAATTFDVVVESCREGIRKPNPKIFELTASRLGVHPEQCIFLDDFIENCKAAESVGMKSIRVGYSSTLPAVRELEALLNMKLL